MSNELTKRQVRAKIYYLKKTGQMNKYKRYLRQYRDYNSEDEDEDDKKTLKITKTIEEEEEEEEENKYLLPEKIYKTIYDSFESVCNTQEMDFLQSIFNNTTEDSIQNLWKFFRDRQIVINDEEQEKQAKNPIINRYSYF
jgi:hypothetical protein